MKASKNNTWKRNLLPVFGVLPLIIITGCIPQNTVTGYNDVFITGGYVGVTNIYEGKDGKVDVDPDDLHELIVAGKAFHDAGKWGKSSKVLELASQELNWKEDTIDTPEEAVRFVATTLTNDTLADYTGKIYEGVMLDYYQALNFLMLGDEAQARIHFNRLSERQSNAEIQLQSYTRTLKDTDTLPEDEKKRNIIVKSVENTDINFERGRQNMPGNLKSAHIRSPSGDLMNALFRHTSSARTDRKSRKVDKAIDAVQAKAPSAEARRFAGTLEKSFKKSKFDKAYILYEDGYGPGISEFRVDLPLALVSEKILYSGIALPEFVSGRANNSNLEVKQGDKVQLTVGVTDLNRVASLEFDSAYDAKVGKEITSAILKTVAQAAINHKIDEKNANNPLAGLLLKAAVGIGQALITQADTRYWNNLPNEIQMAVLNKRSTESIEIIDASGVLLATVPAIAGDQLIYVRQLMVGGDVKVFNLHLPAKTPATAVATNRYITTQD